MGRQLGGLADPLLRLLGLGVAADAGELDEDAVLALAHQGRLGHTEGVHAPAQHLDGLVDVGRGRLDRSGVLGLEDELRTTAQVEAEVGLDAQRQREAPAQETEDEEEAYEGTA